jgi:hypothetical protein
MCGLTGMARFMPQNDEWISWGASSLPASPTHPV